MKSKILLIIMIFIVLVGCASTRNKEIRIDEEQVSTEFRELGQDDTTVTRGVKVIAYKNKEDNVYGFLITGHAGYAQEGNDIVCAAVSVLTLNTVDSIERYTEDKIIREIKEEGYVKGYLPSIRYGGGSREAIVLLNAMISGLEGIQKSYGENFVKVIYIKVRE